MLDGQKILDAHAHTNAPPELYAYKAGLLSSRGYHGKGNPNISDERLAGAVKRGLDIMDSVGTDMQFLSPRPFQLIHSEKPAEIVDYFCEANNDVIARVVKSHPDRYAGVCALPHHVDEPDTKHLLGELGRCINDLGFIGCMINPDPGEGAGYTPPMDDEYWYPLYEEMVKLDVPALIHSAACKDPRESYSAHFITVESQVILNLIKPESNVFKDFPKLKIIVAHGGQLDGFATPIRVPPAAEHRIDQLVTRRDLLEHLPHAPGLIRLIVRRFQRLSHPDLWAVRHRISV